MPPFLGGKIVREEKWTVVVVVELEHLGNQLSNVAVLHDAVLMGVW